MHNYFAAANTAKGFVSWFNDIFDPHTLERTYIIKGGSGTGKSTLMRKIAARVIDSGGDCEYYYCSSDPTSLDGIIVNTKDGKRIAMLDGTAPHMHDPKFPGAAEEIVNLGEYWNDDILKKNRDEIIMLCDKKSRLYSDAYANFAAAGVLVLTQLNEARGYLLEKKLEAAAQRLLAQRMHECHAKGSGCEKRIRVLSALSTHGESYFDSFGDCDKVCKVIDYAGTAPFLFNSLMRIAEKLGIDYDRAPMPLLPDLSEAIRFPALSMAVVSRTDRKDIKEINMSRFVDRLLLAEYDRTKRRTLKKAAQELTEAGLTKLAKVRHIHGETEKIYIGAMDFTKLEEATDRLISKMGI